jgi:uncharacterized protein DUF5825
MSAPMDISELRARAAIESPVPSGGRPAMLTLGPGWADLPGAAELAALLARVPVAELRLAEPVVFPDLPDRAIVRIVALLRECTSIGARVTWSLTLGAEQLDLIPRLDHLPAPDKVTVRTKGVLSVSEWRSSRNFGLLYFRKGPNFLSVVDRRPESSCRIIVDDAAMTDVFFQGLEGCAWTEVTRSSRHAAAARDLVNEGLVMCIGDYCVTLPVHMRSWPIPALDL